MAKGRKTGGRDFQPGHKHGKGRPLIPDDLKEVRKMTSDEAERLITRMMAMTATDLVTLIKDPHSPAMHGIIANIILKGLQGGDTARMEFLFNRTIGRVLDKVQVSTLTPFVVKRPDGTVVIGTKEADE